MREGRRVVVFRAPDADVGLATVRHSSILLDNAPCHHAWDQEMSRTNCKVMVENMNLEALTQPITKVNYSKEREFGKGAWGELTGYTLNTPCFMIP